jgi:hypothetical protein
VIGAKALLVALLLAGPASAEPIDGRGRIAEALYLESGMGDYRAAATQYLGVVDAEGVPQELRAEACFRLGLAYERLGEADDAEAAYEKLLAQFPGSSWAEDGRFRLRSLDEDRKQVAAMPVAFDFSSGLDGLYHARNRAHKGRIAHELEGNNGVVAWRTHVVSGEDDILVVGFKPGLGVRGEVELNVRARTFPTHLAFFWVDASGRRFGTSTIVVRPEEGWQPVKLSAVDFADRAAATAPTFDPAGGVSFLMIQDVTGYSSTDRGDNVVLLDAMRIR